MFSKLSRKYETDGRLNLATGNSRLLVVASKASSFLCKLLKDVVDEGVHDPHGFRGDACVRVHLLQNLEDVDLVGLDALLDLLLLLVAVLGRRRRRNRPSEGGKTVESQKQKKSKPSKLA